MQDPAGTILNLDPSLLVPPMLNATIRSVIHGVDWQQAGSARSDAVGNLHSSSV